MGMSAVTGEMLAQLITGAETALDPGLYSLSRFG